MKPEQISKKLEDKISEKILGQPEMGISGMESLAQFTSAISEEDNETPIIKKKTKKSNITDLVGNVKMNKPIGKLYTMTKGEMMEGWSKKYKDSIDCDNPKGFSQKAHCQGKNKKEAKEATASGAAGGGFIGKVAFDRNSEFVKRSFTETPSKGEFKEGASSASSGSYETPAAWAKSTSKKDWRGKSKTLFPGGKFVQVKKKCKTFPYCNQGDINALNLTNESKISSVITKLSEKYNISEDYIKKLILKEYYKGKV